LHQAIVSKLNIFSLQARLRLHSKNKDARTRLAVVKEKLNKKNDQGRFLYFTNTFTELQTLKKFVG